MPHVCLPLTSCQQCGSDAEVTPVLRDSGFWRSYCRTCGMVTYVRDVSHPNNERFMGGNWSASGSGPADADGRGE